MTDNEGKRVGPCTHHSLRTMAGSGIFLLLKQTQVLLVHERYAVFHKSIYLDRHGEEDISRQRGVPLFLNAARYSQLHRMFVTHGIHGHVVRQRVYAERHIIDAHF